MSIAIFQPSVAPFVQQAARALDEAKLLDRFYTTLIDDPTSRWQRVAKKTSGWLGRDLARQFQRRRVTEISRAKVTTFPLGELIRLSGGVFDRSGRLTDILWERAEIEFSKKVARRLSSTLKGVYGYEFSAREAFVRAKELGLTTFYDVPAPEPDFVENLLRAELERYPELKTAYTRHTSEKEKERTMRRREEWELADHVIAASRFTQNSFAADGRSIAKIHVIPYGAPPPAPREEALRRVPATPLRFVWAGTFSVRKGAHYLLEAWNQRRCGRHATLDVYGSVTLPERLLQPAPSGIVFHGPVTRDELLKTFQNADALLFPTLCDGFGMVVTEAWSQGLPVIITDRAGAFDLLKDGENGLSVAPSDAEKLGDRIESLIAQPTPLSAMREGALATASAWQWSDYRNELGRWVQAQLALRERET